MMHLYNFLYACCERIADGRYNSHLARTAVKALHAVCTAAHIPEQSKAVQILSTRIRRAYHGIKLDESNSGIQGLQLASCIEALVDAGLVQDTATIENVVHDLEYYRPTGASHVGFNDIYDRLKRRKPAASDEHRQGISIQENYVLVTPKICERIARKTGYAAGSIKNILKNAGVLIMADEPIVVNYKKRWYIQKTVIDGIADENSMLLQIISEYKRRAAIHRSISLQRGSPGFAGRKVGKRKP